MARTSNPIQQKETSTASKIRLQIETAGEGYWTYDNFGSLPPSAVAQSFSRLTKEGFIQRAGKGLYYRPRTTILGLSRPSQTRVAEASAKHKLFPAGISAANLLGFTTQNAGRSQYATSGSNRPTKLAGSKVYTRRPTERDSLDSEEGALLEFLRMRGALTELSPEETIARLLRQIKDPKRFARLTAAAVGEPPRVRAMLGAIGEQSNQDKALLDTLRKSLNLLSRFDFGELRGLKYAKKWQAK